MFRTRARSLAVSSQLGRSSRPAAGVFELLQDLASEAGVQEGSLMQIHCVNGDRAYNMPPSNGERSCLHERLPPLILCCTSGRSGARRTVSVFLACCFVSLLTGCQQQQPWHLTASKRGDTVQLCLSNELTCPQPEGVSPAGISVYRYDSLHDNEIVWDTEPDSPITSGRISGLITYGIPPKDWSNKIDPPALI
jgi:hypothetical protein